MTVRGAAGMLAGAQILFKSLAAIGAVGYVPKGPVLAADDSALRDVLFAELAKLARDSRILFLAMQPPAEARPWLHELPAYGFQQSKARMGPTATIWLNLARESQVLLNDMNARTRYNIRLSHRKGIRVREGSATDLKAYYNLVLATAGRKGFVAPPESLFSEIWSTLAPSRHVALLLAEYEGHAVSAQLLVTFGDTAVNQLSVWSGAHSDRKPNEALHWYAILWAKEHGYQTYDFEGIDAEVARVALQGGRAPDALRGSYSSFKLGFGGQPVLLPGVYDYIYDPAIRTVYETILSRLTEHPGGWLHAMSA